MAMKGLDASIAALHRAGIRVVLIIDKPTLPDPGRCIDRRTLAPSIVRRVLDTAPRSPNDRCAISYQTHLTQTRQYRDIVDQLQQRHPELIVYDPVGVLCDRQHDTCPMIIGDKFLYSYGDHISDFANGRMAKEIDLLLSTRK
jgi:hypothetical protein